MKFIIFLHLLCLTLHLVSAPPPRRSDKHDDKKKEENHEKDELEDFGLEYNRYLKEVVDLLESDPEFKRKLEDAQEADIRSGKIAQELEYVDHKVRTKLDEVKRQELERLRHLAQKQYELTNGIDTEHIKISADHLDHANPHTFELEDLKKLIAQVSADLVKADEKRRQEFKEYEMQKEFEKQERLKHLEGAEKEAFQKQVQENETKHKQHEPLHHPGSKQQLEEVWEKQDHMENQQFDPKVFFKLHDLDGNGAWDQNEVKALFLKELDKMYEQGAPEDDMKERAEEMERMREHVFGEADRNRDGLISYEEFVEKTKQPDFDKDPGWEGLDEKPAFTQEEYQQFEKRRQEEVQRLIEQGLIPPQPVFHPQYGYHHPPPAYGHHQPPYHQPPQYQGHHQFPQHPQGYNQNQFQPNYHPNQMGQGHPNQLPHQQQQQFQQNHPPQYQQQQNQQYQPQQNHQQYQQQQNHQQYQPQQNNQQYQQQQNHQQYQPQQNHQQYQQQNHQQYQQQQNHQQDQHENNQQLPNQAANQLQNPPEQNKGHQQQQPQEQGQFAPQSNQQQDFNKGDSSANQHVNQGEAKAELHSQPNVVNPSSNQQPHHELNNSIKDSKSGMPRSANHI